MCFFLAVVRIRPGLTSKLRQRVHTVSEHTSKERDYRLLVTDESLIDSDLSQVSLGEFFYCAHGKIKLAYRELEQSYCLKLVVCELTYAVDVCSHIASLSS